MALFILLNALIGQGECCMNLRENIYYWMISLQNPEPVVDNYYIFDEIIIDDKQFIEKVEKLRELIISYCVVIEKDENVAEKILDDIFEIISIVDKIQYTEFVAFWKTLDISFSIFKQFKYVQLRKSILAELLKRYCLRRRKLYDKLGYSNVVVQALYDSGVSRSKGVSGIKKVLSLASEIFNLSKNTHLKTIEQIERWPRGYFLPDGEDKELFELFCKSFEITYQFGREHQGKRPDIVLKIDSQFFIIEIKHIKESGGAQDKQIAELIDFIKHSEKLEFIHYVSFIDGIYFNNFISCPNNDSKIKKQKEDIEKYLKENPNNFFVNTAGLMELFTDISK